MYERIKAFNKGRKKPEMLVIGKHPDTYAISIEPVLTFSVSGP
jgi:hypothetical protein